MNNTPHPNITIQSKTVNLLPYATPLEGKVWSAHNGAFVSPQDMALALHWVKDNFVIYPSHVVLVAYAMKELVWTNSDKAPLTRKTTRVARQEAVIQDIFDNHKHLIVNFNDFTTGTDSMPASQYFHVILTNAQKNILGYNGNAIRCFTHPHDESYKILVKNI